MFLYTHNHILLIFAPHILHQRYHSYPQIVAFLLNITYIYHMYIIFNIYIYIFFDLGSQCVALNWLVCLILFV